MGTPTEQEKHQATIVKSHRLWQQRQQYMSLASWTALGLAVLLAGASGYWLYWYSQQEAVFTPTTWLLAGAVGSTIILLAIVGSVARTNLALLQHRAELDTLRLDIFMAVQEAFIAAIEPRLANANRFRSDIELGESLLQEVRQVNERAARLQSTLALGLRDGKLPELIQELVKQSLIAQGLQGTNHEAAEMVERLDASLHLGDNVAPLTSRSQ